MWQKILFFLHCVLAWHTQCKLQNLLSHLKNILWKDYYSNWGSDLGPLEGNLWGAKRKKLRFEIICHFVADEINQHGRISSFVYYFSANFYLQNKCRISIDFLRALFSFFLSWLMWTRTFAVCPRTRGWPLRRCKSWKSRITSESQTWPNLSMEEIRNIIRPLYRITIA